MALLPPLTRDQVAPDLLPLWDECARHLPAFEHLWSTMAHSPTIFRSIWSQLLELKRESPVQARHFELAIVVVSALNRCTYCVSHHAPLARQTGYSPAQVEYITGLTLGPLPEDHVFPPRPGFSREDGLVIDLAHFLVGAGLSPHTGSASPRVVHVLRRRLFALLAERFTPRQIEELVWRTTQCVAFNWHNEFLEIDVEPGVTPGSTSVDHAMSSQSVAARLP
jgi:AhpD family alkylhydroperoxidase